MNPIKRFLLILALISLWSPSFLFIKLALTDFSPATIVFLRVFLASLLFLVVLRISGGKLPSDSSFWVHSAFMAIFSSALPFFLFCYAETTIESALAAILNGCTPMFTALLAHLFIPGDRLSLNRVTGIIISFTGVLFLFSPNIYRGMDGNFQGMLAAGGAAFSYAISHVYAKKFTSGRKRFVAPAAQMLISAVILLPFTLWSLEIPQTFKMPSVESMGAIAGLTLLGTFTAFIVYYKLIEYSGPTDVSMVACFFPVAGMLLGFFFLGESINPGGLFSAGLILVGMLTVNEVITWRFGKRGKILENA